MEAPIWSLKTLGWEFEHVSASDPKGHALCFTKAGGVAPQCHFGDIAASALGKGACMMHQKECVILPQQRSDLYVIGSPCQPNSELNNNSFAEESDVVLEKSSGVIQGFVEHLAQRSPLIAIFENVRAIDRKRMHKEKTVLDIIMEMVSEGAPGYSEPIVTKGCVSAWMEPTSRERVYVIWFHEDLVGKGQKMDAVFGSWMNKFSLPGPGSFARTQFEDCMFSENDHRVRRRSL